MNEINNNEEQNDIEAVDETVESVQPVAGTEVENPAPEVHGDESEESDVA